MPKRAKALLQRVRAKIGALSQRGTGDGQEIILRNGKNSDTTQGLSQVADPHRKHPKSTNGTVRRSKPESKITEKGTSGDNDLETINELDERRLATSQTSHAEASLNKEPVTTKRSDMISQAPLQMDEVGRTFTDQWSDYTEESFGKSGEASKLASVPGIDLASSVDVDHDASHHSAVTHETVRPHVHEIVHEQIHRDIHTYDHYHHIQPVHDLEILPARHFVPNNEGILVEVAERDLPGCTGINQKWAITNDGFVVDKHNSEEAALVAGKI